MLGKDRERLQTCGTQNQHEDMQLFREDVLRHRMDTHLGAIRLGRPLGFAVAAATAMCAGGALLAFAGQAQLTRKASLTGLLWPIHGVLPVIAPQGGVLSEVRVSEGQVVEAGQVIAVVDLDRDAGAGRTGLLVAQAMAARRAALETERRLVKQQSRHRSAVLADQLRRLEAERWQAQADAASAQRRLELARRTFDRYARLAAEGFVSPLQAQDQEARWIDASMQERDHHRVVAALGRDIDATRAEQVASAAQARADVARLDRAVAALEQEAREDDARRRVLLVAQRAGVVGTLTAHPGQTVLPGQPLATVLPGNASQPARLEAHLYAESRTAGFIRHGQSVRLRYDAYPHRKFGMAEGRVTAVSHTPIAPHDLPPGLNAREPLYRLTVQLTRQSIDVYGKPETLKSGMTLKGDIRQDTRAIWEWLLEPILATPSHRKLDG